MQQGEGWEHGGNLNNESLWDRSIVLRRHFSKCNDCIMVLQENVLVLWRYLPRYSRVDVHNHLLHGLSKTKCVCRCIYMCLCVHKSLLVHVYAYIHIYVYSERERGRKQRSRVLSELVTRWVFTFYSCSFSVGLGFLQYKTWGKNLCLCDRPVPLLNLYCGLSALSQHWGYGSPVAGWITDNSNDKAHHLICTMCSVNILLRVYYISGIPPGVSLIPLRIK